jgi:cytochrome oxidase assembly protein ShyY1
MTSRVIHLLPLAAGLAAVLLTVQLGNWQLRRAQEKAAQQAQLDALTARPAVALRADAVGPPEWLPLRLEGHWLEEGTIYLDNRTHGGRAGYHVFSPFVLADGSGSVLVNRGWIAAGTDRNRLPAAPAAAGRQTVEGLLRTPEAAPFTLATEAAVGRRWQVLDLAAYRERSGLALASWTLQQSPGDADGLVRDWPRPDAGIDRHRGYAFQWYALAALAGGLGAWQAWRLFSRRSHEQCKSRLV